jgi:hypothetical protein
MAHEYGGCAERTRGETAGPSLLDQLRGFEAADRKAFMTMSYRRNLEGLNIPDDVSRNAVPGPIFAIQQGSPQRRDIEEY